MMIKDGSMIRFGNQRLTGLVQSEIRAMTTACTRVKGINLAQGVCDTGVPEIVMREAKTAIDAGINTYTRFDGLAILREALASRLATYNHIKADPETDITVSAGATGAFQCACMALLNPGDEAIVFEPYYGYHMSTLQALEIVPRLVPLRGQDWELRLDDVVQALTDRTRAIVVNTPGNPSGKVFNQQDLERLADLAQQQDLLIFTDEIYEYFLYDQREHVSIASLAGMADRTITISGYSKTFSITGWRIGHSVAPAPYAELIALCLRPCPPAIWRSGRYSEIRFFFLSGGATNISEETGSILRGLGAGGAFTHDSARSLLCVS